MRWLIFDWRRNKTTALWTGESLHLLLLGHSIAFQCQLFSQKTPLLLQFWFKSRDFSLEKSPDKPQLSHRVFKNNNNLDLNGFIFNFQWSSSIWNFAGKNKQTNRLRLYVLQQKVPKQRLLATLLSLVLWQTDKSLCTSMDWSGCKSVFFVCFFWQISEILQCSSVTDPTSTCHNWNNTPPLYAAHTVLINLLISWHSRTHPPFTQRTVRPVDQWGPMKTTGKTTAKAASATQLSLCWPGLWFLVSGQNSFLYIFPLTWMPMLE